VLVFRQQESEVVTHHGLTVHPLLVEGRPARPLFGVGREVDVGLKERADGLG
jgi:hypothetical protein